MSAAALVALLLAIAYSAAESAVAFAPGDGLVLRLSKLTTADHHFSLDPYCGLLCEPEFAWRMAAPRLWWWTLFPGEQWMASGWAFVVLVDSGPRQLCIKAYDTPELLALMRSAVEREFRLQGQLSWGVPLVTRVGVGNVSEVDDATVFEPGVPLGRVGEPGADILVYTHVAFVVHYCWDTVSQDASAVVLLGVQAIPSGAMRLAPSMQHSYSVTWKATDPRFASRFPARVPVSHFEWFPAANTFVVLYSALLSLFALLPRFASLPNMERRAAALAQHRMALASAQLPVWGVLYYSLVAAALYCVGSVTLIWVATGAAVLLRISVLYRLLASGFVVVAMVLSLACGYAALPVSGWAQRRWPALTIASALAVAAASSWALALAFVWWNSTLWIHPLLAADGQLGTFLDGRYVVFFAIVLLGGAAPATWLGAWLRMRRH